MAIVPAQWRDEHDRRRPLGELRDEVRRIVEQQRPDVVHANSLSIGRVCGPVLAELGVPGVAHLRDIVKLRRAQIADLNEHRRLIAVSQATREFHVAQGLDAAKTAVVYNGVDLERFSPRQPTGWLHRELGAPPAAPLVGAVGQIALRKGLDTLLAAAERASEMSHGAPPAQWVVVGECYSHKGESQALLERLRRAAVEGPLAGRLHLVGQREDVDRILPECTLLVHAARQEPLGRVLLEAAACGAAIVATDVGGSREIFRPHDAAAALAAPDDAAALARCIAALLADDDQRRRLGRAARRAAERFTIAAAAGGLIAELESALWAPH